MTPRATYQAALEALESCVGSRYGRDWNWPESAFPSAMAHATEARDALRAALAAPQPEPVAWMDVRSIVQQAHMALEDLQGPGYLIGGVMHHRIGLILPKLNEAIDKLSTSPTAQPEPLTDEQIDAVVAAWFATTTSNSKDQHPFRKRMRAAIERAIK